MSEAGEPATTVSRAGTAMIWKAVQMGGVKVIFMLRLLILAWLLSPDDFGLLAIATTAIGFLLQITDVGMIPALVQGKEVEEKHYDAAWTVGIMRTIGVASIVILAAPIIADIFSEPRATPIIQVLALRPPLDALASIKVAGLTRRLDFRPLAMLKLAEALTNLLVSVSLASSLGVWALVAGTLAGSTAVLLLSYMVAPHRPRLSFRWSAVQPLIRFGRWIFLNGLIVIAGNYALRIVISRQLGTKELGLYFLAAQLAFLPIEAASEIVGAVAFPLFARLQAELQSAAKTFRTVFTGVSILLFPVCILLFVLAPSLVEYILGTKWDGTVPVIQVLALVSLIGIFGEVAVPAFNGFGFPYWATVAEGVQSLIIIAVVWWLTSRFGLLGAALAWLISGVVYQIVSALLVRRIMPSVFSGLAAPFVLLSILTGVCALIAFALDDNVAGLAGLVLAIVLSPLAYIILLFGADRLFGLGFTASISRIFPKLARIPGFQRALNS